MVYGCIETEASRHVLLRDEAGMDKWWPDVPGSSITFIRPRIRLDVLRTCRLLNKEATPILQIKMKGMEHLPSRLLISWSALAPLTLRLDPFLMEMLDEFEIPVSNKAEAFIARYTTLRSHFGPCPLGPKHQTNSMEYTILMDRLKPVNMPQYGKMRAAADTIAKAARTMYIGPVPEDSVPDHDIEGLWITTVHRDKLWYTRRRLHDDGFGGFGMRTVALGEADFARHLEGLDKY
jgi:hypothetical protein